MTSLAEALNAFRAQRSRHIANAVVALGTNTAFTPPVERKNFDFHRAWLAAAKTPDALNWCLSTLLNQLPKLSDGVERSYGEKADAIDARLKVLLTLEPDPRIGRHMVDLFILDAPVTGFFDTAVLMVQVLERHADDGCAQAFEEHGVRSSDDIARPRFPAVVELTAAELSRWKAWAPKPVANLDALWAAACAAPDDDAPREVLSDALQELGEPRGEFIALQLREARGQASEADSARARELAKAHGKSWLGELRPIVQRAEFRRGLLFSVELGGSWSAPAKRWKDLAKSPLFATVEQLDHGKATGDLQSLFIAEGKALRSVDVFDDLTWDALTTSTPPGLRGLRCFNWKRHDVGKRFRERVVPWLEATPAITRLGCWASEFKLVPPKVRARLRAIECRDSVGHALKLWEALPKCTSFTVDSGDRIELVRRGREPFVRVTPSTFLLSDGQELRRLPNEFRRVELIGNAAFAKRFVETFKKRFEVVSRPQPSGLVTAVK